MRKTAFLSLLLLAACAAQGGAQAPAPAPATPPPGSTPAPAQSDTLARIHALIGSPSCSEDSQCRTLPVGARACGGPEGYLAYSTAHSDAAQLQAMGASYQAERRKANAESGRVSDCRFIGDPGAVCRAGTCVLGTGQVVAR